MGGGVRGGRWHCRNAHLPLTELGQPELTTLPRKGFWLRFGAHQRAGLSQSVSEVVQDTSTHRLQGEPAGPVCLYTRPPLHLGPQ